MDLADRECTPRHDVAPLAGDELDGYAGRLGHDWQVVEGHHLEKDFRFPDFAAALSFTNRVGALADEVDHHPEICLTWGRARVTIYTHSIGGLQEADFVFAAKTERLASA